MVIAIGIIGAAGRMGKELLTLTLKDSSLQLVGGIEHSANKQIGKDLGKLIGKDSIGLTLESDLQKISSQADILVDFSLAPALCKNLLIAQKTKTPMVIGSTGFTEKEQLFLTEQAQTLPIFYSSNFSLGMALMRQMVATTSKMFPGKISIIETHHEQKKDAPSGSALSLAKATNKEVAIQSIRKGKVIGEHVVNFTAEEEEIIFSHRVTNRAAFAQGALQAAKFLYGKPPKLYSMDDLLCMMSI